MLKQVWYSWTTFWNNGGDHSIWIDVTDTSKAPQHCSALVRREDGLIFQNTLTCYESSVDEFTRTARRAVRSNDGYYLVGEDVFGTLYDANGRHLSLGAPVYVFSKNKNSKQ